MNKELIIKHKNYFIGILLDQIALLNYLELNRVYKIKDFYLDSDKNEIPCETWGYTESFNKKSVAFRIIATDNPKIKLRVNYNQRNIYSLNFYYGVGDWYLKSINLNDDDRENYKCEITKLYTPATKNDLPLLIGLPYIFKEFELILKGKKKVLLND